jgi:LytS/YehU family sensor histidine kinase
MNWVPVMTAWVIIYFLIHILEQNMHIREEKLEAENLAKTSELELLKIQLNPHFLFNALNSIKALVLIDAHKSRDAIIKLSELLRFTLNYEKNPLISLEVELAEVEKYLSLERIRFDERLRFSIEADDDVLSHRIPPASVLTLAENAIKHGISTLPGGGEINIKAWKTAETLYIDVVNTGILKDSNSKGIGLKNVRQRMQKILGENAGCTLSQVAPDQVRSRLFYSLHSNSVYAH